MKMIVCGLSLLIAGAIQPISASAADDPALLNLAARYAAEVDAFEQLVLQIRGIDRGDERLVDRLNDEATRMRLAARNPRHFNRLFHQWQEVQKLHAQTEATIFAKYTPHHDLIGQWERVIYSYALFAEEFYVHVENPSHQNSVRRLSSSSARRSSYLGSQMTAPNRVLGNPVLPNAAILHWATPNAAAPNPAPLSPVAPYPSVSP